MATVTTHDLSTLAGFSQGHDLIHKRALKLYPEARLAEAAAAREQDRHLLLAALRGRGLLGEGAASKPEVGDSCPGFAGGRLGISGLQ